MPPVPPAQRISPPSTSTPRLFARATTMFFKKNMELHFQRFIQQVSHHHEEKVFQ